MKQEGGRKENKTETEVTNSRYTRCFFLYFKWRRFLFQHLVLCKIAKANSKEIKQGFRLPHYGFKSVQNLDLFKSVPGVCRNDNLQERGEQCKKKSEKNAKTMFA